MHHAGPRPTAEKPRAEGFPTHDTWHPTPPHSTAFFRSLLERARFWTTMTIDRPRREFFRNDFDSSCIARFRPW